MMDPLTVGFEGLSIKFIKKNVNENMSGNGQSEVNFIVRPALFWYNHPVDNVCLLFHDDYGNNC